MAPKMGSALIAVIAVHSLMASCTRDYTPVVLCQNASCTNDQDPVTVSPSLLAFGDVDVGISSSRDVALTNNGPDSVTITELSVTGAGFTGSGLAVPVMLAAVESRTFAVAFAPLAPGDFTGEVSVALAGPRPRILIPSRGKGVQAASPPPVPGPVVAYPGAEGGGALSVGGRGGNIYLVTNTADAGAGSLRACVEASGPRTCIFRTGGTIVLASSLTVANPFITIAGQTAPGGGIQLRGPTSAGDPALMVTTHDVVIQYLRVRRGHNAGEVCNQMPWSCGASMEIFAGAAGANPYNIMLDHMSAEWSNYDAIIALGSNNTATQPRSLTVSHSIIGEALGGAGQAVGVNFGGYSGQGPTTPDGMTDLDLHHNLFAGSSHRMPLLTVKSARLVNNIVYGWTYYPTRHKGLRDLINNSFKMRANQSAPSHEIQAWTENAGNDTSVAPSFYLIGNVGPSDPTGTNNWAMTALAQNESAGEASSPLSTAYQRAAPIPTPSGYVPHSPRRE